MQSETIQFYATHPQHMKENPEATIIHSENNSVCGDNITIYMDIENGKVRTWSFSGEASFITIACSGLFGDLIMDQKIETIFSWHQKTLIEKTGITVSPRRQRAQVLALLATRNALHTYLQDGERDDFSDVLM